MAEDKEVPVADQAEKGDTEKEQTEKETAKETEQEERDKEAEETPEPKFASQPGQKEETKPAQGSTDVPEQEEPKQEETKPEETKQQEQTVTAVSCHTRRQCRLLHEFRSGGGRRAAYEQLP